MALNVFRKIGFIDDQSKGDGKITLPNGTNNNTGNAYSKELNRLIYIRDNLEQFIYFTNDDNNNAYDNSNDMSNATIATTEVSHSVRSNS